MRMHTVYLHHQPGAVVVDMDKGFRPIDFRQFHFGIDFGDAGYIAKVPDLAEGEPLEPWR